MPVLLLLLLLALLLPLPAAAQGFAGLGSEAAEGFAEVRRDVPIRFPQDHGAHPDFRIEWWYVTANLEDAEGNRYGLQWTLFRSALAPPPQNEGWASQQLWMAHAAVSSADTHLSAERFARGGIGQAGVEIGPFRAFIDGWQFASVGTGTDAPFSPLRLAASAPEFSYDLILHTDAPMVLQGEEGYSVKSERGQASHYFSQPFFEAGGTITIEGREIAVTGRGWMDREWSTQPLSPDQTGWDWFSLRFGPDTALMAFRLRQDDGRHHVTGNWLGRDGSSEKLRPGTIEMEPLGWSDVAGREVPTRWRIRIPSRGLDVTTEALNPQSWMETAFSYWEGPVRFEGTHAGEGYLEMTGY